MPSSPDVVIIGSGIGGGTLANRLVQYGLTVTMLERGDYLPHGARELGRRCRFRQTEVCAHRNLAR